MLISFIALTILMLTKSVYAQSPVFLLCPYEHVTKAEWGINERRVLSLERFLTVLRTDAGDSDQSQPYIAQEVAGNRAVVYAIWRGAVVGSLTAAQPLGAGCSLITRDQVVSFLIPGRAPKLNESGQIVMDDTDTTRQLVPLHSTTPDALEDKHNRRRR